MGLIGYLGTIASILVAESYEGMDDHFRKIALTASNISGEIKEFEGQLILHLILNEPLDNNEFIKDYESLRNKMQEIRKIYAFPQANKFADQMEVELEKMLQQGMSLLEKYYNDIANTGRFQVGLYRDKVKSFHASSSAIRKIGVKLADESTLYLNRQKPITTATESGSYAKRAEGHLMLFLTLNDPIDKEKFFKRHTSLMNRIIILRQLTKQPDALETIDKMKVEAEKMLQIGQRLVEAYDSDSKMNGVFQIEKYRERIQDFSSVTSLLLTYSKKVMLYNFDWETNKTKMARVQANDIQRNIIVLVILCISFASLFGYVLYRPITRSIEKLKLMSIEIGKGNLEIQSGLKTNDEFYELGVSFNQMSEALKSSRDELLFAKEVAENANQAKSEFLSHMSHELRTPMNAILGFGQLLELDDTLSNKQKDSVQEILMGGQHLMEVINEVLDLSKIEAGKLLCSLEDCSINNILKECLSLIEPLAAKREIQMINNINLLANYTIHVDCTRFKQVIVNLLSNAIKYNNDKGTVTLNCDVRNKNYLRINVIDTGNGLTEQEQERLFKPFERIGDYKGIDGTGIGLVISKRLVELMGGAIGVQSQPGKGSTFWIQIALSETDNKMA